MGVKLRDVHSKPRPNELEVNITMYLTRLNLLKIVGNFQKPGTYLQRFGPRKSTLVNYHFIEVD